jgi:hypothetical protein
MQCAGRWWIQFGFERQQLRLCRLCRRFMWACLLLQDVHCPLTFLCAGDQLRPSGLLRARRQAASVAFDIMRASFPHSPILKELFRRGNHECYMQRQRIGMSDSDSNSDISPGVARYQDRRAIQVGLRTPLFYHFRDCICGLAGSAGICYAELR